MNFNSNNYFQHRLFLWYSKFRICDLLSSSFPAHFSLMVPKRLKNTAKLISQTCQTARPNPMFRNVTKKNRPKSCNIWELCSEMLQKCNISEHGHIFWNISEQRHRFCNISEYWLLNSQFRRNLSLSLKKQHLNVKKYDLHLKLTFSIVREKK